MSARPSGHTDHTVQPDRRPSTRPVHTVRPHRPDRTPRPSLRSLPGSCLHQVAIHHNGISRIGLRFVAAVAFKLSQRLSRRRFRLFRSNGPAKQCSPVNPFDEHETMAAAFPNASGRVLQDGLASACCELEQSHDGTVFPEGCDGDTMMQSQQ